LADETEGERQFLIARYNADRAHELELEKITGLYELAFFQAAAILNGVSATVFLSFFGSTFDKVRVESGLLAVSFFLWLAGLFFALWGGHVAYEAQKRFVSARRNRRHATGARVMGASQYARLLGVTIEEDSDTLYARADRTQTEAQQGWNRARYIGVGSMTIFLVGAILALVTLLTSVAAPKQPQPASNNSTITCYFCRVTPEKMSD
jgi:hypothetical protein